MLIKSLIVMTLMLAVVGAIFTVIIIMVITNIMVLIYCFSSYIANSCSYNKGGGSSFTLVRQISRNDYI